MDNIEYIVGNKKTLENINNVSVWKPFDQRVIKLCSDLSVMLSKGEKNKMFPDIVSLMFWLRKSNIKKIANDYGDLANRFGRGMVFHIAPGNIALSFAYSLITGLLTGNTNVIRLPSRRFEQTDIFCDVLKRALVENDEICDRICMIKYPHNKEITNQLSLKCYTRIIWGGDETVNAIRCSPIMPRTNEIVFSNRFSICIIDADKYLLECDYKSVAHSFYIDTYLTDQNACSSPRIIFWIGEKREEAKVIFWNALYKEIIDYPTESVTIVDKLVSAFKYAAENKCRISNVKDFKILRVQLESLNTAVIDSFVGGGLFFEYDIDSIEEILPICVRKLQTISYIAVSPNAIYNVISKNIPHGVDRIVNVGHTLDFDLNWDGRDVVREMTREVVLVI